MKKISCIYKITNLINGKIYIGKTNNFKRRIKEYKNYKLKKSNKYAIMDAIRKYGFDNFNFEIVERCDEELLDEKEIYYIKYFNSCNNNIGYNKKSGGKGGILTEDSKLKMSNSSKGFRHSDEHIKNMSKPIIAYDLNTGLFYEASSAKEFANSFKLERTHITRAIKNNYRVKNFIFFYKNLDQNNITNRFHKEIIDIIKEGVETIKIISIIKI